MTVRIMVGKSVQSDRYGAAFAPIQGVFTKALEPLEPSDLVNLNICHWTGHRHDRQISGKWLESLQSDGLTKASSTGRTEAGMKP